MTKIVAFALAVSVACPCAALRADDPEDKAVAFVKELGGRVTRDETAPGNRSPHSTCATRK